jgi:uncharacterized protein YecT (DUF1311 family)
MKIFKIALILMFIAATRVMVFGEGSDGRVIACDGDKVVLFDDTTSRDGRYAIGWSLRRVDPKAKPVDWSLWNVDEPYDFLDKYDYLGPEVTGSGEAPLADAMKSVPATGSANQAPRAPYELYECVVDLKKKRMLPLRSDWPYWPHKNHGDLNVIWSGEAGGVNYAVVVNGARFSTANLWLVTARDSGLRQVELTDQLAQESGRILKQKRPLSYDAYAVTWADEEDESGIFNKDGVRLDFTADIPKMDYETVKGSVVVNLATGKITKAESDTAADDPFRDNPELAKVDKELNATYAALLHKLNKAGQETLRKEQRAWLNNRDYSSPPDAGSNLSASVIAYQSDHLSPVPELGMEDDDFGAFNDKRDKSLIESTRKRTAELKKRLQEK